MKAAGRVLTIAAAVGLIRCQGGTSSAPNVSDAGAGNTGGRGGAGGQSGQGTPAGLAYPPSLQNQSSQPGVIEVSLTAALGQIEYLPGQPTQVWAYNGSIPGPTLSANIGDRIIVHFRNDLAEATTIHWHGLRVPSNMDGAAVMNQPVPPSGTFDYEFTAIDSGVFWYHPHVRSDVQVRKGLYGAIVIRGPEDSAIPAASDDVVILNDAMIDPSTGALVDCDWASTVGNGWPASWDAGTGSPYVGCPWQGGMMGGGMMGGGMMGAGSWMVGWLGNTILVNGATAPRTVDIRAGEMRRLRVINAANARYFNLALDGGTLVRVGGGQGLLQAPEQVNTLLLAPGQRADLVASVSQPGHSAVLRSVPYPQGWMTPVAQQFDLLNLRASNDNAAQTPPLPSKFGDIPPPGTPSTNQTLVFGQAMEPGRGMVFTINGQVFPNVPLLTAQQGSTQAWSMINQTMMDHPFHLHGFRFQLDGKREWMDTVNVPSGATVRILPEFDARPGAAGSWLYHCHILEHAEGGMMGEVQVQ